MTYADDDRPRRSRPSRGPLITAWAVAGVLALVVAVETTLLLRTPSAAEVAPQATAASTAKAEAVEAPSRRPSPTGAPRNKAAVRAAASRALDAYAAGNYGRFWDSWRSADQQLVSRADYLKRWRLCPSAAQGLAFEVQAVAIKGDLAVVQVKRSILVDKYRFVYEDGAWRYQLLDEQRQPYETKSVEQIVASEKAAGNCG